MPKRKPRRMKPTQLVRLLKKQRPVTKPAIPMRPVPPRMKSLATRTKNPRKKKNQQRKKRRKRNQRRTRMNDTESKHKSD